MGLRRRIIEVGVHRLVSGRHRIGRRCGVRAGERCEHLPHVGELGVDAVAALADGGELPLGLGSDPVGGRAGLPDDGRGALLRLRDDPADLRLGGLLLPLRRCPGVHDLLGQRVELGLRLGLLLPELGGGTVPALGQGGLEVRSGLSGIGALLLEDGLALLPAGRGVPLRRVTLVIGSAPGIGEGPRRLGVGIPAALLGVLVGLVADGDDGLVGELPRVL